MTARPVQCQQNRNLPETFNSQTGTSQLDIASTEDWFIQYIKHCQRALPMLVVPFGNVLCIEYIANQPRLALSKINKLTTRQVLLPVWEPRIPSSIQKAFLKATSVESSYVPQRRVIPPLLSITSALTVESARDTSIECSKLQSVSLWLGHAIHQTWVQ